MDGPLPFPAVEPVDNGPRWLPYKPPPIGEWIFSELSTGEQKTWTLRVYPVFEARIYWYDGGKRFHLVMNGTDFGRFRRLDPARQRAEREIIDRVRQMMPALAIVRRRLAASPTAREEQDPARVIKTRMPRHPVLSCGCGAIADGKTQIWSLYDYRGRQYFSCYKCMSEEDRAIVDRPIAGQGITGFTAAKCECLREAVMIKAGIAYCEECQPRKEPDA